MSHVINIRVTDHVAEQTDKTVYICGNNDYEVNFKFDAEWDEIETKTARFIYGEKYIDVSFTGNTCAVPVMTDTRWFKIGVYSDEIRTTTSVRIGCLKSILSGEADELATWTGGSY